MKHSVIINDGQLNSEDKMEDLQQSLDLIEHKLDAEIQAKQTTIDYLQKEIQRLHLLIESKDKIILDTSEKLVECMSNNEGNRQLINKLLNDIDRVNQDIEWYKRTYETRSFVGTISEKIKILFAKSKK